MQCIKKDPLRPGRLIKAANYKVPLDDDQYLLMYPKHKLHQHDGEHAVHKKGPIETGTIDYKAADYKIDHAITDTQYSCYSPVNKLHERDHVKTPRKIGAIETGWADAFDEYNSREQNNKIKRSTQESSDSKRESKSYSSSSSAEKNSTVKSKKKVKNVKENVSADDIDAYLPRRFSSDGGPNAWRNVTKGSSRQDESSFE